MKTLNYKFIAVDQYESVVWIKKHPRKELMELYDTKHARNCYRDIKDKTIHTGYVICDHWYEIFKVGVWK